MKFPDARPCGIVGGRGAAPRARGKRCSLLTPPVDKDSSSSSGRSRSRSRKRGRGSSTLLEAAAESTGGSSPSTPISEPEKPSGEPPAPPTMKGSGDNAPPMKGGASASRRHPVYDEVPAFLGLEASSAFSFGEKAPAAAARKNHPTAATGDALGGTLDQSNSIYGSSEEDDLWQSVEQESHGLGGDLWPTVDEESIREADELWGDPDKGVPPVSIADGGAAGRGGPPGLFAGSDDGQSPAAVGLDRNDLVKNERVQRGEDPPGGREDTPAAEEDGSAAWPARPPAGFPPLPLDPPPRVLQLLKPEHGNIPRSAASFSAGSPDGDLDPTLSSRRNVVSEQPRLQGGDEGVARMKAEIRPAGTADVEALRSVFFSEARSGGAGGKCTGEGFSRLQPSGHHPVYGVVPTLPPIRLPFAGDGDGGEGTAEANGSDSDGGQGATKRIHLTAGGARSAVVGEGGGGVAPNQEPGADPARGRQAPVRRKKRSWVNLSASVDDTLGFAPLDPSSWPSPQTLQGEGSLATVSGSPEVGDGQLVPLPTKAVSPDKKLVQSRCHQPPELQFAPVQMKKTKKLNPQPQQHQPHAEPPLPQEESGPDVRRRRRQSQGGATCKHTGCARGRTCGYPGPGFATTHCVKHKRPGMVNLVRRRCASELCSTAPSYGFDGKRPTFCRKHRLDGMINVVTPRCIEAGCTRCASYGSLSGGGPMYCAKHKIPGMSNLVSRKCAEAGCAKTPSFGREGDPKATFCVEHKLGGMVNVVTLKCLARACRKAPSFGMPNDRKASFCKPHMQPGMVNLLYTRVGKTGGGRFGVKTGGDGPCRGRP